MILSKELRKKIRSRARRAFDGEVIHRITEVEEKFLLYRIPSKLVGAALYGGPKIVIRRDRLGRIFVPTRVQLRK